MSAKSLEVRARALHDATHATHVMMRHSSICIVGIRSQRAGSAEQEHDFLPCMSASSP